MNSHKQSELYRLEGRWGENPFLKKIRDNDLAKAAPFSASTLFVLDDERTLEEAPETAYQPGPRESVIEDVPIARIVGVTGVGHLQDFTYGMTFRQVLFMSLHGASLTASSLDYFLGDSLKGDNHQRLPGYTEMPQDERCIGNERARGGITLLKRGDYYFADHGKQRTLMAMFWIFQNRGERGTLNKVSVERRVA